MTARETTFPEASAPFGVHVPTLEAEFELSFGGKGERAGQVDNASAVVGLADDHSIAVADVNNRRLQIFDKYGLCRVVTGLGHLKCPWNMCRASTIGDIYLTDGIRKEIIHYDPKGAFINKLKLRCPFEPNCVAFDCRRSLLYISDFSSSSIHVYNSNGDEVHSFELEPDPEVVAENPFLERHQAPNVEHMILDSWGQLLVAFGSGASKVHIYTTGGRLVSTFGSFANAVCIHATAQGRLLVTDRDGQKISLLSQQGDWIQDLLSATAGLHNLYPQAVTMIGGNTLVFSAAEDLYGTTDRVYVFTISRKS